MLELFNEALGRFLAGDTGATESALSKGLVSSTGIISGFCFGESMVFDSADLVSIVMGRSACDKSALASVALVRSLLGFSALLSMTSGG